MEKKLTIAVSEQAARWIRRKAAAEDTSVSKLVDGLLLEGMQKDRTQPPSKEYWRAYRRWKKLSGIPGLADDRLSREAANSRR